ncbi:hypothetical protein AB4289_06105 [Vibrio cyclitrophicus]
MARPKQLSKPTVYCKKSGKRKDAKQYDITNTLLREAEKFTDLDKYSYQILVTMSSYLNLDSSFGDQITLTLEQIANKNKVNKKSYERVKALTTLQERGYIKYVCQRLSKFRINVNQIINISEGKFTPPKYAKPTTIAESVAGFNSKQFKSELHTPLPVPLVGDGISKLTEAQLTAILEHKKELEMMKFSEPIQQVTYLEQRGYL